MKYSRLIRLLLCLISVLCVTFLQAQEYRLMHADDYHGNYDEIDQNKPLLIKFKNDTNSISGKIIEVNPSSFTFEPGFGSQVEIGLDSISAITSPQVRRGGNNNAIIIVLKYIVGVYIGIGSIELIGFGIIAAREQQSYAIPILLSGIGLATATYYLFRSTTHNSANNSVKFIHFNDARNHLFIEEIH